ncbi:hypothetical protein [Lutibacter oricola]|nr:hypothetical protein [Lutibacter oricola]
MKLKATEAILKEDQLFEKFEKEFNKLNLIDYIKSSNDLKIKGGKNPFSREFLKKLYKKTKDKFENFIESAMGLAIKDIHKLIDVKKELKIII